MSKLSPSLETLFADRTWTHRLASAIAGADGPDLMQDAYLGALRRPPTGNVSWRAWLTVVMRRRARDVARERDRRVQREQVAAADEPVPTAAELVGRAEAHTRLVVALNALDAADRDLLLMRFFQERSSESIASALGIPAASVRRRIGAAIDRLRAEVDTKHGGRESLLPLIAVAPLARSTAKGKVLTAVGIAAGLLPVMMSLRGCGSDDARTASVSGNDAAVQSTAPAIRTINRSDAAAVKDDPSPKLPRFRDSAEAPPDREHDDVAAGTLAKDDVHRAMKAAVPAMLKCYGSALERDPNLHGRLVARFRLRAHGDVGKIIEATFAAPDDPSREPQDPLMQQCVLGKLADAEFPAPVGGDVEIEYPFVFSAARDAGARHWIPARLNARPRSVGSRIA